MQLNDIKTSQVYISDELVHDVKELIKPWGNQKIFILTDENTHLRCLPLLKCIGALSPENTLVIKSGDENKNLHTLSTVWQFLSHRGADRQSLLINLGGGMVTDLGGFAASTFKRGISFINIPTTLLSQVDAAAGGKTGINFEGFKNEIGVFNPACAVLIHTGFLQTLDGENIKSGFAEMIKHALIHSPEAWNQLRRYNLRNLNTDELRGLIAESIRIKEHFVQTDPTEKGIRKALNFGHTIGHAFESLAIQNHAPIPHGYAVAFGMVVELYLSQLCLGFPNELLYEIAHYIEGGYGHFNLKSTDYQHIYNLMLHDKKNENGLINYTLLKEPGNIQINQNCSSEQLFRALDLYKSRH
jgi:3-dehydroquinate synthase